MQPTSIAYTSQQLDMYMDDFKKMCQERGLRVTRQRVEVFRALMSSIEHPGAEAIFATVRQTIPTISLDTVYRTLASLEEAGLITRVGISNQARYDAHTEPHYHFICMKCGEVYDIFLPEGEPVAIPSEDVEKFGKVMAVNLQFRGVCTRCQRAATDVKN